MLFFVFTGKDWETDVQFVQDAAQRPHVDGWRVPDAHHDLWRSVKTRLDVSVKLFFLVGATSEVNDFDATLVALAEQDVLRLHIAVDDFEFLHVVEGHENLNGKSPHQTLADALEIVQLDELVEVHGQHFEAED